MKGPVRGISRVGSAIAATLGMLISASAFAQYSFDPNNADEQTPGIKYFGSAKDERGALLSGVTVLVSHAFGMVTDDQGRYRGIIPFGFEPDRETVIGCSKPGYTEVRVITRPGPPGGVKETWQVDCVLRKDK